MRNTSFTKTLAGCLIITLLFTGTAAAADEIPPLPAQYFGTVTLGGEDAPAGTIITAQIDETSVGSLTLTESGKLGSSGTFGTKLLIGPASPEAEGKTVTFWIGTTSSLETMTFKAGDAQEITLTFAGTTASSIQTTRPPVSADSGTTTGDHSSDPSPFVSSATNKPAEPVENPPLSTQEQTTIPVTSTASSPAPAAPQETPVETQTQKASVPLLGCLLAGVSAVLLTQTSRHGVIRP